MKINNFFSKYIILPLSDIITGQSIYNSLLFLEKSQSWSRDMIDDYQNVMLRKLVHHAYNNVQFYNELFLDLNLKPEDIQSKEDLIKIPIITKDILKKNNKKLLAKNIEKRKLIFSSSSGSTGEPFQFFTTKRAESMLKAAAIRGWEWMGYNLGDKYIKISMNPRNSIIKRIQDIMNNSLYLSSTQLSSFEFSEIEKKIIQFKPKFIRCYPVPLHFLSQQIKSKSEHAQNQNLIAINTTGSTLHHEVRSEIEGVFGVKIFDSYSCEGGTIFAECKEHSHYHPAEEYAISEFIDDNYTLADPEHPKRHITTDLYNYATPFIRYDTQDYVVLGDKNICKCQSQFLNIKKIKGRDSDILVTPSGKFLIVENFVAYFEWINEVDQIQVVQNKKDEIEISMIVNENFNNDIYEMILSYWENYIGNDVKILLKIVDCINLTPTGKRRTVIRNIDIPIND